MRKSLAHFFLACSIMLVLGHSFMPHNHQDDIPLTFRITEKKNLTLADIVKFTLSFNLGANHLEEYNTCKILDDELTFQNFDFIFTVETVFSSASIYIADHAFEGCTFTSASSAGSTLLRAPPVLS
jgi:hypothetical protein